MHSLAGDVIRQAFFNGTEGKLHGAGAQNP